MDGDQYVAAFEDKLRQIYGIKFHPEMYSYDSISVVSGDSNSIVFGQGITNFMSAVASSNTN